ncbi:hypothetical protein [Priestia aryabhattai]
MSLKGRLNRIQNKLPQKEEKEKQNELNEKVASWLIENKHQEFMESLRQAWRISIKGEEVSIQELAEYTRLINRINEIVEEYTQKDVFV